MKDRPLEGFSFIYLFIYLFLKFIFKKKKSIYKYKIILLKIMNRKVLKYIIFFLLFYHNFFKDAFQI